MGSDKAKPAYCEDVDDSSGRAVRDTRRTAAVKPKVSYQEDKDRDREREKEREKRRSSNKHRSSKSHSDAQYPAEQSTSAAQHVEIMTKDLKLERRKSSSSSTKSPRKSNRPPSAHENRGFAKSAIPSSSKVDPSHFGIAAVSQPIPLRPRAHTSQTYPRPQSFHAAQTPSGNRGPPLSSSAYYQQPVITPSYPPPSPVSSYMQYADPQYNTPRQITAPPQPQYTSTYQYPAPQQYLHQYTMSAQPQYLMPQSQGQADYFAPKATVRPLSARFGGGDIPRSQTAFEPVVRTSSAFGSRDTRSPRVYSDYDTGYYDDGYTSAADGATIRKSEKRNSIRVPVSTSTMSKAEADSRAMPPPRRPSILRRTSVYNSDPISDPGPGDYYERETRPEYREEVRPRRPSVNRHSVSYDLGNVRIESANSGRRRQSSYEHPSSAGASDAYDSKRGYESKLQEAAQYQGAPPGSSYEAKLNSAASYQDDVGGGPTVPLTAEVLRRQQRKQGGSSRSTKSSASRDESDYKKSATTRTTRSGSGDNDENVTLKVTGQTRVMVGGMQIDCSDGGEISIQRQKSLRNGSERSNSEYGGGRIEDRQSRVSRPSGRSRMSSQSGESWTRTPQYPKDYRDGNFI
ncbi:hypothetical protein ONS95_010114 [Cadophora gregata]|uniref:uncharacterized protein n=1 Tax=Cadophora gregata TaxID=51156 RepID=UPI0026DD0CEE|nr:uncharacterized protein ONS95_010114 [Cadophora gregata]KAK0121833.1 hypothetical protein ONS95_010114 [Cadophora gregata]KAK0127313.1 hypothetical protein ONS96_006861 [Cadophora gregata f. sp. sojae]